MQNYNFTTSFLPIDSPFTHVAIIPDGARRWAKRHACDYRNAYSTMVSKVFESIQFLFLNNIDIVTVFFSSIYNFKRPIDEIHSFCTAESFFLTDLIPALADDLQISIKVVGSRNNLPSYMLNAISFIENHTMNYTKRRLYLCVNYSSIHEINQAAKESPNLFVNHLRIPHPVNILVRTGNANVLSDFLLVQCASARLFFLDKYFNDITIDDFASILNQYHSFDLKYGE